MAPASSPRRSGPTIQSATAVNDISGQAVVTPAPTGSWTTYLLVVCETATPANCLSGVPSCAVNATGPATCLIPGLQPGTEYSVTAVAQSAGSPDTSPSGSATFTTSIP